MRGRCNGSRPVRHPRLYRIPAAALAGHWERGLRKFGRVDLNQQDMVLAARGVGVSVWVVSAVGGGGPDLILGCPRTKQNYLVELKDGSKPPSARVLTPAEATFHRNWRGQLSIIEDISQLYRLLGVKP